MLNPITNLILFLSFSISVLLSYEPALLAMHFSGLLCLLFLKKKYWAEWKKHTKPFWKIFPFAGLTFFAISFLFSDQEIYLIIYDVLMATIRLMTMVSIMSLYFVQHKDIDLIRSIRSLWYKTDLKWQWVDRLFLFMSIVFRFFPSFQDEWKKLERSQKSLYRFQKNTFKDRINRIAYFIPDYIILNLEKSKTVSHVMKMRGYGKSFPRSVYPFISFSYIDCILLIIAFMTFYIFHAYQTI
tara:strand:- start:1169 stop:1891 length:723 start_codon:yes stop_codon:yes gene_type:complete